MKISRANSKEYDWGEMCKGWHLLNTRGLSVIEESMPPGTEEIRHKHLKSQQFFYILNGQATFVIEGNEHQIDANQGIHIKANIIHQIKNNTDQNLEFIVISQPHSHGDRIIENGQNKK